ncbi:methionine--tRNA ligase [[Limnothrix rosea] IAM M-220]|uniref:methionine--tRNA ligase n=1 Tax=[Limnothrix rosea] IAM M-220 TaxID=454133 RepID=UPI00095B333D|nr:methionine--tRNA ligase [[Limnothrix rosea] IAM M-220]OKH19280.1 methionine--tRNA ligase [[Limnothrix rosea] IAM M-220]
MTSPARFSITTPLYYVNGLPHIGSAYTTMAADAIARFHRLQGEDVLLITGTDEHGQKIQRAAEEAGLEPQVHCDRIIGSFKDLWEKYNIQYDRFSRTTAANHAKIVEQFFGKVWDKGDIYLDQQQGWYCVACEEFKEEKDLIEDRYCAIHTNKKAEWRDEQNYFFRLSNYQAQLEALYASNPDFIQPASRRNEVLNFVKQGLKDFSISRINLDWGFPVPTDVDHTIYVWFDALLGYFTALLEDGDEVNLETAIAKFWPINVHLIGKDILRFHAVYWPAMLMSAELPLPGRIFGHGFLTKNGLKMGKSLGNIIDPFELVDRYGSDALRYYFLKEVELGKDGDFNEVRFINTVNADLANDLGNLLNRTLGMLKKYCKSEIPQLDLATIADDHPLKALGHHLGDRIVAHYEALNLSASCTAVLELIQACNKYIDDSAPWKLFKAGEQSQVEVILFSILESVRLAGYLLAPIIPNLSTEIYRQLGFSGDFNDLSNLAAAYPFASHSQWGLSWPERTLPKAKPIFARLELPQDIE